MASVRISILTLAGGITLTVIGILGVGAGLIHIDNVLVVASGTQFLGGLILITISTWQLTKTKLGTSNDLKSHSDAKSSTDTARIAKWAEIAMSPTNAWMNAIRLHETGEYADACYYYLVDALNSSVNDERSRAALSLSLATHCFEQIGQNTLASKTSELAQVFGVETENPPQRGKPSGPCDEDVFTQSNAGFSIAEKPR